MKTQSLTLTGIMLLLALTITGCNSAASTPITTLKFPPLSPQTETAVFESTRVTWTPGQTETEIPTATNTPTPTFTATITRTPSPKPTKAPSDTPTITLTASKTLIPSKTFTPSKTSLPTRTFTVTRTPTLITPRRTKTPSTTPTYGPPTLTPGKYNCTVYSVDPRGYQEFHPGEDFDGHVKLYNSGSESWTTTKYRYRFINGDALHKFDSSFAIPNDVATIHTLDLVIDMVAPTQPGKYVSVWSFEHGQEAICTFAFSITVLDN